jgi:hypothetical protein
MPMCQGVTGHATVRTRRRFGDRPRTPRSRPYENSFVTGVPVTTRDGRLVKSS